MYRFTLMPRCEARSRAVSAVALSTRTFNWVFAIHPR